MNHETNNSQDQQLQTVDSPENGAVMQSESMIDAAPQQRRLERTVSPRASVYETPEQVVLELEMPGASRDSVEIKLENDELSVSAYRTLPASEGFQVLHQERASVNYRRTFLLSDRIDSANIKATCKDGVLHLTLPKAAQAKPRRITIE